MADPFAGVTSPLDAQPAQSPQSAPATDPNDPFHGVISPLDSIPQNTAVSAAPQVTGARRYIEGAASETLKGIDYALGLPGEIPQLIMHHIINPAAKALGYAPSPESEITSSKLSGFLPTVGGMLDLTGKAGLTDRSDLVPGFGPNPELERLGAAGFRGAGTALATLPFAPLTGGAATTVASNIAGSVGGEVGNELFPGNKWAPVVLGGLAGLSSQGITGALGRSAAERIAMAHGDSATWDQAGTAAQDTARKWLAPLPTDPAERAAALTNPQTRAAKIEAAYAPVNAAVPPSTPVPLTNYEATLRRIAAAGGNLQKSAQRLGRQQPVAEQLLEDLYNRGGPSTWNDVKYLHERLGDTLNGPATVKDVSDAEAKQIYGALQQDRRAVAQSVGVGTQFDQANATAQNLYKLSEGPVAKLVAGPKPSVDDPLPGVAAKSLIGRGKTTGSDLSALRAEMPDAVDEITAAHLRTSPQDWTRLSPEAKAALVPEAGHRDLLNRALASGGSNTGKNMLEALVGEEAARSITGLASHFLADTPGNSLLPGYVGSLIGLGAPMAYRAVKSLLRNPQLRKSAAMGAASGGNALFPNPAAVPPQAQ